MKIPSNWLTIHPKVSAATIGSAVSAVITWVLSTRYHIVETPSVQAAVALIATFVSGYWVSSKPYTPPVVAPDIITVDLTK